MDPAGWILGRCLSVLPVSREGSSTASARDGHKTFDGPYQTRTRGSRHVNAVGGGSTAGGLAIVHFGSVGRLWGLFERSKATQARN